MRNVDDAEKGGDTDDAKKEDIVKLKQWVQGEEEEEKDTMTTFHQKYTQIRRPFGSWCEEFGLLFRFQDAPVLTVQMSRKIF